MSQNACPRLCVGCPALPEGVKAELTELQQPTEEYMRQIKYGGSSHGREADRVLASRLVATFTVIESGNPGIIDVGDTARLLLTSPDIKHSDVREGIDGCIQPVNPTGIQRMLGQKATCGGLPNYVTL